MNNEQNNAAVKGASKKPSMVERFKHAHIVVDDASTNRSLKVTGLILIALLCLFVFVKTINEVKTYNTIGEPSPYVNQITVNGHAEVKAKRDTSKLSFSSQGEGKTTSEAQTKAAVAINKAIEFAKSKGIAEADISTQGYNTYPKYDQKVKPCVVSAPDAPVANRISGSVEPDFAAGITGKPTVTVAPIAPCNSYESVIVGYTTSQTVEITIKGVDMNPNLIGEIIDGLGAAGVQVGNVTNGVDDNLALKNDARLNAIIDARHQAEKVAKSLGVRLGKVVSYYDNSPYADPAMESSMARDTYAVKSVAPMIPTGEAKVTSDVSVSFEIR